MNKSNKIMEIKIPDAEIIRYTMNNLKTTLDITIRKWNKKEIEYRFLEPIAILDNNTFQVTSIIQAKGEGDFFDSVLQKAYDVLPLENPYKLFQFLDVDENPAFQIIATNIEEIKNY